MNKPKRPNEKHDDMIYQDGNLRMTVQRRLDPAALTLLKNTIYGTTGVRYQHTNQETKVNDLDNPLFFHLWQQDSLIGMYCLDERPIELANRSVTAFYGRYLSVAPTSANKHYGRLLKQQAIAYVKRHTPSPFLFYSYIEEKNTRSIAISKGEAFASVAYLKTYFFRRYAPVVDPRFAIASPLDLTQLKPLLHQYYQAYSLKTLAHIGYQDNYFILKEGEHIVAGIQANPVCWRISHMPGIWGSLLMTVAPLFSASRRFLNPQKQAFAVLEGLYLAKGREELLPLLLESVLTHLGIYSAMWQIDEKDPLIALLVKKNMGRLSGFQKEVKTHVMVKTEGLPDPWLAPSEPVYVSCFDYS